MAGAIPNDPVWARWFHPAADLAKRYGTVARSALPRVAPSLDGIVWTANHKPYSAGFPLQLSPQFAAPYRAYRIAQLLRARPRYDVAYFAQMQMDALSLPERELARDLSPSIARLDAATGRALAGWDGQMTGDSTTATLAEELRVQLTGKARRLMPVELAIGQRAPQSLHVTVPSSLSPWSVAGAVTPQSALSSLGMTFLDGTRLPGYGDEFALHVQYAGYSQSFRAVWDVGNWEAGGIILPQGESGEPGSGHYTDEAGAWVEGPPLAAPLLRRRRTEHGGAARNADALSLPSRYAASGLSGAAQQRLQRGNVVRKRGAASLRQPIARLWTPVDEMFLFFDVSGLHEFRNVRAQIPLAYVQRSEQLRKRDPACGEQFGDDSKADPRQQQFVHGSNLWTTVRPIQNRNTRRSCRPPEYTPRDVRGRSSQEPSRP